jgi:hypothetical protein
MIHSASGFLGEAMPIMVNSIRPQEIYKLLLLDIVGTGGSPEACSIRGMIEPISKIADHGRSKAPIAETAQHTVREQVEAAGNAA